MARRGICDGEPARSLAAKGTSEKRFAREETLRGQPAACGSRRLSPIDSELDALVGITK